MRRFPLFGWHEGAVYQPRIERLTREIASLAGSATRLLDVGCGDGTMAKSVAESLGARELAGVDVKIRPNVIIDAKEYDGRQLPFPAHAFDLVTVVDVLHHAEDPAAVIAEALRVLTPDGQLIIKDHFRLGSWSNSVLLVMDLVGNYASGVLVRGPYLSPPEWVDLVARAGGRIERLVWPLEVHSLPWRLVTRSEYQFLMKVRRA